MLPQETTGKRQDRRVTDHQLREALAIIKRMRTGECVVFSFDGVNMREITQNRKIPPSRGAES